MPAPPRPPTVILLGAGIAFTIAAADAVAAILAAMSPEGTGRIGGTLLRDAALVLGGVMLLRRHAWALWLLVVLFALTLLRLLVADEWHELALNGLGLAGLILLLTPEARRHVAKPPAPAGAPPAQP